MKKNIVKLRILGIATFLLYILLVLFLSSKKPAFYFTQVQEILIFVSLISFAIVMILQVYRFYIKIYAREDEDGI